MRGIIKAYSVSVNAGVIECDAGKTYEFHEKEWNGTVAPVVNDAVQFEGFNRTAKHVRADK